MRAIPNSTATFVNVIKSMSSTVSDTFGFRQLGAPGVFRVRVCRLDVRGITTRIVLLAILCFLLGGCMSMKPVDLTAEQVREQVRAGKIVRLGDHVSITTEDGLTSEFEVRQVKDQAVQGDGTDVPIDSIVNVRTRQLNRTRSALVVVGVVALGYVIAVVHAMNEVIDDILGQ